MDTFLKVFFVVGLSLSILNVGATGALIGQKKPQREYTFGAMVGAAIGATWWLVAFVAFWSDK